MRRSVTLAAPLALGGVFEDPRTRRALLDWLATRRGVPLPEQAIVAAREQEYDRLAAVRAGLDLVAIKRPVGLER